MILNNELVKVCRAMSKFKNLLVTVLKSTLVILSCIKSHHHNYIDDMFLLRYIYIYCITV